MKLYIDTNIYLAFVNPASGIKSLEKLKKLIGEKKIELVLPSQTKEEFLRNFKERVTKAKEKLKKSETQFKIPNELKSEKKKQYTKEEEEIINKIDSLNKDLKKHRVQKIAELRKHIELTEKLVNEIFKLATFFEYTDDVILRAVIRYAKGLPPRKENLKFGDAIIWETLKENIKREDIVIVSVDSDFSENTTKKSKVIIKKLLAQEWKKHFNKKITLYSSLGEFVNTLDKEDKVSQETIKKETLQSSVFAGAPAFVIRDPNSIAVSPGINIPIFTGRISPSGVLGAISAEGANSSLFTRVSLGDENNIFGSSIVTMKPNDNIFKMPETGNYILQSSACTKCGKPYTPSLTTININGWCNDCSSKSNGIFFAQ